MIGNPDRMDVQRKKRVVPAEEFRSIELPFLYVPTNCESMTRKIEHRRNINNFRK